MTKFVSQIEKSIAATMASIFTYSISITAAIM